MDKTKRERLLKAAIKVFARDGFYKAKVEDIAREASVATGTTYLYFENKDDLLISIFDEEMTPIIEQVKKEMQDKETGRDKIKAFLVSHFKVVESNPDLALLLEVELRQSSKFLHSYSGTRFKEYLDVVGEAFEEGQRTGEFRADVHPSIFKQFIFGGMDTISMNYALSKTKKIDLHLAAEQITRVLIDGIKAQD